MIEQILEFIGMFWRQALPFYVIDQFERAVILRLGKKRGEVGPGLHFKVPFIDDVMSDSVVTDTYNLPPQSLTTSDNVQIAVSSVVRFRITDISTFKLEITDEESAMQDICMGAVMNALTSKSWLECQDPKVDTYITNKVRSEVSKYGVYVERVRLTDLTKVRSIRIFGSTLLSMIFAVWLSINTGHDYIYDSQYYSGTINADYNGLSVSFGRYYDDWGDYHVFDMSYEYIIYDF